MLIIIEKWLIDGLWMICDKIRINCLMENQ
jgi:hypothetical protein